MPGQRPQKATVHEARSAKGNPGAELGAPASAIKKGGGWGGISGAGATQKVCAYQQSGWSRAGPG